MATIVRKTAFLLFGIFGGASVLLLAYARHASTISPELIMTGANMIIPHALLGMFALSQSEKIGIFSCIAALLAMLGILLFAFPVSLMGMGILNRTITAPFGGLSFAFSWVILGLGFFLRKADDKA